MLSTAYLPHSLWLRRDLVPTFVLFFLASFSCLLGHTFHSCLGRIGTDRSQLPIPSIYLSSQLWNGRRKWSRVGYMDHFEDKRWRRSIRTKCLNFPDSILPILQPPNKVHPLSSPYRNHLPSYQTFHPYHPFILFTLWRQKRL